MSLDLAEFYTDAQRAVQQEEERIALADTVFAAIVSDEISDEIRAFVENRDFFFLASVDETGMPTVSYKGGPVGVVEVVDPSTLRFPSYDGNGMYKSMGNVSDTGRLGLLFIDLETPNRVRVQGNATISRDPELLARWPGSKMVVEVEVTQCFLNCARYIHKHTRVEASPYVPEADGSQPHPAWKRIDLVQPALSDAERARTQAEGGPIDFGGYADRLSKGQS
ncbi:MAG: pyridoxamine 5'-phosphate oxidase family protein [Pseudomonadota bacterium]